jgi:Amt family ammonium transporter
LSLVFLSLVTAATFAQDAAPAAAPEAAAAAPPITAAEVDQKVLGATVAANNSWVLTSSALVLMMTAPGLAMFYCGLVRKKNVLSVIMQCVFLMGLNAVIWAVYGYSLSFGGDPTAGTPPGSEAGMTKYVGNGEYLFMKGVQQSWQPKVDADGNEEKDADGKVVYERKVPMFQVVAGTDTIPMLTHMLFQGMFFIITPALICGAFAERMKFSTMVVFSVLWGTIVYMPLCHWVWDYGILGFNSPHAIHGKGALDFAGGTVVHISSGVSALVCAIMLGKRLGYGKEPMPPHNVTYTALGAALLWVGWFGFNGGSELGSDDIAAGAFAATHFSAAAAAIAWAVMEWIIRGKPTVLGTASGAVAGLVCITPASGFVTPMPAIIMGGLAGVICFLACTTLKSKLGYDDSLDVFGVHGIGGTLGAILTGVFASRAANNYDGGNPLGMIDGNNTLIVTQIIAVGLTWVLAIVATTVILKVLDIVMGLRVTHEEELRGLDISLHGEEGYIFT